MRYRVELSAQAVKDLRGIYRYIAHELRTPDSADGQLLQLEDSICGLDEVAEDYPYYDAEPWHTRGLRRMSVDRYAVFYLTDREEFIVTVVRVMYVGQDVEAQLAADDED